MSVKYMILGSLMEVPNYGYLIKTKFFKKVFSDFGINDGQLYPTLNKLEKEGLIRKEVIYQEGSPNRHKLPRHLLNQKRRLPKRHQFSRLKIPSMISASSAPVRKIPVNLNSKMLAMVPSSSKKSTPPAVAVSGSSKRKNTCPANPEQ